MDLDENLGKCSATVLRLAEKILTADHCKGLPFHFMMDNLFTTPVLLRSLKERGCEGTGTVRQNRIRYDPLLSLHDMKKKPRGISKSAQTEDGVLKHTKWKDNQVVSVLLTVYGEKKRITFVVGQEMRKKLCLSSDLQLLLVIIKTWEAATEWGKRK